MTASRRMRRPVGCCAIAGAQQLELSAEAHVLIAELKGLL
ncbi:hypothetical protein BURMUCGD2M_2547 [Burkholderia multivorans CGD2M]|uniref:Uncharacterized protein n=1 Tax=Burkholderia multivorans CGD2 TaxID=513052 RepID=B9BX41_9BURK|nr:hypothetical protein BURMUCGD2_2460 [Burkholderia multivorans CGD2]EEE11195.1 hypothetical protein BURMUCGD2M_2547 [Burkholderia multivorans CGD2M]